MNEKFADIPTTTQFQNIAFTSLNGDLKSIDKNAVFTKGMIMAWAGKFSDIPNGWSLCNGQNGTPDLRGRFILSYNDNPTATNLSLRDPFDSAGRIGGEEEVKLTVEQLPSHDHIGSILNVGGVGIDAGNSSNIGSLKTGKTGGNQPHNNMPPFYVLAYIMKID